MALRKFLVAALSLAVTALAVRGQDIPVEKYTLDNGMTVILRQDKTLPVACVNIWYRVGAKDEPPGRSGFAHLFEHLMFMGTKRVPGSDFDIIMETGGGANNASTSLDRTNYFSSGPASLLPTLLWLDADRLEDLGRMMDQAKLDKQRDVVRNELRQIIENAPYQKAGEALYRLMYPAGHPYHEAVYGTHQDLEAATVINVKDFFATFYVPSNASLVVAGDFDTAAIKPLIAKLFGTLPRGGEVKPRTAPPAKLDRVIRTTMLDKVQLPMVKMAWHSPAYYADGDAEMDLLAAVLSQGKNSRLYKRLVFDDKIAVDVAAYQASAGLGSMFCIDVTTAPDADLGRVEKTIDEELARLGKDGIQPAELEERKASYELSKLASLQSIEAVADKLNEYEYIWAEPNSFKRDLDRYRNATPAKVQWWAMQTLDPSRRVMIRVLPEEPDRADSPRDAKPADSSTQPFAPKAPDTFTLTNGIPVMLWNKPELPLVSMLVQFNTGAPLTDPATAGVATLTAQMLEEGSGELEALAFASAMQSLGADLSSGAGHESAQVSLTVLKRNFDRAAALTSDAIRRPRLTASDWDRVKRLHLEELKQQDEEPPIVAGRVGARVLYGDDNPYAWPTDGTPETVEKLTLDDVKKLHGTLFRPELATIYIAGDISVQEAKSALDKLMSDWPRREAPRLGQARDLAAKPGSALRVVIVDRPEAVQTVIRFVAPGPKFATDARVRYRLLNTLLGGSFTSRLNQNLRERNGFTYGAGSGFTMTPYSGSFTARSSVRADVTGAALKEFFIEFKRLQGAGDITDDEAAKARETLRTDTIQTFAGLGGVLGTVAELSINGLSFDTIAKDLASMTSVKAADLNSLSKQALPIDQGVLVLVGDKRLILEQIKDLGLPQPVELDERGRAVVK
jgi:zinc protease